MELGGSEVDDCDHLVFVAVASGSGFGCLDQGVDAFEQAVGQVVGVPGEDAVPVALDEGDEVFDGLEAGAFRGLFAVLSGLLSVRPCRRAWGW